LPCSLDTMDRASLSKRSVQQFLCGFYSLASSLWTSCGPYWFFSESKRFEIVPGITASNPLDLYYMPYTHSLVAGILWAVAAIVVCKPLRGVRNWSAAAWIGLAVFSHWVLDLLVHRPDLPLYDDTMKVGLGMWNYPVIALFLEALLLFAGMTMYLRRTRATNAIGRVGPPVFGILMLAIQCYVFFGPPPSSPSAAAISALVFYAVFGAVAQWLDRQRSHAAVQACLEGRIAAAAPQA
jgi:hypothetical protein